MFVLYIILNTYGFERTLQLWLRRPVLSHTEEESDMHALSRGSRDEGKRACTDLWVLFDGLVYCGCDERRCNM